MNVRTANDTVVKRLTARLTVEHKPLIGRNGEPTNVCACGNNHFCKHCGARIAHVCGVWIHSETPPEVCFFAGPKE